MPNTRRQLLLLGVGSAAMSIAPQAHALEHELVHPRTCLAGHWGTPVEQWRLQFGVFQDEAGAERLEEALRTQGVPAPSHYIAVWLAVDDTEPMVVVSRAMPDAGSARRAARSYRRKGISTFARHYQFYQ